MTESDWRKLREMAEAFAKSGQHQEPCPSCGHCPCCGRGGHHLAPYYPQPYYPYDPWYQPQITWTTAPSITITATPHLETTAGRALYKSD